MSTHFNHLNFTYKQKPLGIGFLEMQFISKLTSQL